MPIHEEVREALLEKLRETIERLTARGLQVTYDTGSEVIVIRDLDSLDLEEVED